VPVVAGKSVLTLQVYLRREFGDEAYERLLDELPNDEAAPMRGIVLPVNWYPTAPYVRAIEIAHARLGDGDFADRFGAFAAEYQINMFQKFILRFASPTFFLDRAGRLWHRFHDTGEWEIEGGDKRMTGTLRNFAAVSAIYCRVLVAWIHRASQLTGTVGETVHSKCRARGDDACVFAGSWR
jgi:hypothetical protein